MITMTTKHGRGISVDFNRYLFMWGLFPILKKAETSKENVHG
jgi:hypothetical protein